MKLDFSKLKKPNQKNLIIISVSVIAAVILAIVMYLCLKPSVNSEIVYEDLSHIEVTDAEIEEYKNMIGTDMDIKKSVFILFESEEECRNFIETHGADEHPEQAGLGIVPLMENGYYNIVGKEGLEEVFNTLADGEYSKEPVLYSNMFCYLKRIGIDSPTADKGKLIDMIRNDKMQKEKAGE